MASSVFSNITMKDYIKLKSKEIQDLYKSDNRPWVIGYSGGKDSTTTLQLIYNAIFELKTNEGYEALHKDIYVITSDTLVENPLIIDYIDENLDKINTNSTAHNLCFKASSCKARYSDSFWTLLIGKGYPSPRQKFRWCTDRLKIKPIDRFILDKIDEFGEVIVVLGVRSQESSSRKQTIENHRIENRLLKKHTSLNNAFTYTPIEDFSTDDVWGYLLQNENPWNSSNKTLFELYSDSQDASECPMQIDKDSPSCGNSRFGCWTCTVVQKDKSLTGFLKNGHYELEPLLEFRDFLFEIRNKPDYRQEHRLNGSVYYMQDADGNRKKGFGPFNLFARKEILRNLLEAQKKAKSIALEINKNTNLDLITIEELQLIRAHWIEAGDWEDSLPKIYEEILESKFAVDFDERDIFQDEDRVRLASICDENGVNLEIIKQLINLESKNSSLKRRTSIIKDIDKLLSKDWLHEEIIESLEDLKEGYKNDN